MFSVASEQHVARCDSTLCLVVGDPQGDRGGHGDEGADSLWWRDTENIPERGEWGRTVPDVHMMESVLSSDPKVIDKPCDFHGMIIVSENV